MGDSPKPPPVADPNQVAAGQQAYNTEAGLKSQKASMVNQVGPQGSLTYSQTGTSADGTPIYSAETKLSPENQKLLDILQGTKTSAGTQGQNLITGANYGAQQPGDVIGNATSGLVKDAMAKQVAYLQPQMDYDRDRLDTQLRNQGLHPGEPGYDKAMNALKQSQGQTITGFEASLEPQMFQQAMQQYLLPSQLGAQLAGFGSPTDPTFINTPSATIQPANLIGATANAQDANFKNYQANLAQNQNMMSGLFGIPTAVLGGWAKSGGLESMLGGAGSLLGDAALMTAI